ncbi:TlpA family protein disulfide reductase [Agathobaculum sp.]|uniref:TlpA family protein disulfide reductase n=1 Tax=Agathobaculum sp. TaxID=2048138 RepID=UPI0027B93CCE|nr:TlpA disulfide reductase family protein [Agathobaculum sp.]
MKLTCLAHTGAALACLLTLAACSPAETMTSTPGLSASEDEVQTGVLSAFSTTDLEGNTLDQSILADYDLTMVNVWATFCGPCINEMPDLGELAAEYADKGVQIIGLVSDTMDSDGTISDSQVETAKEIVAETGADYRHLLPSDDLLGILSQIYAVPTTFFVDSEGVQVGDAIVTAQSKEKWIETIDGMLAEVQA